MLRTLLVIPAFFLKQDAYGVAANGPFLEGCDLLLLVGKQLHQTLKCQIRIELLKNITLQNKTIKKTTNNKEAYINSTLSYYS